LFVQKIRRHGDTKIDLKEADMELVKQFINQGKNHENQNQYSRRRRHEKANQGIHRCRKSVSHGIALRWRLSISA
jgi:hypothetical protein